MTQTQQLEDSEPKKPIGSAISSRIREIIKKNVGQNSGGLYGVDDATADIMALIKVVQGDTIELEKENEELSEELVELRAKLKEALTPKYAVGEMIQYNSQSENVVGNSQVDAIEVRKNEDDFVYYLYSVNHEGDTIFIDESEIIGVYKLEEAR